MSNGYPSPYPAGPTDGLMREAPLDQPLYGASFGQAIKRFFTKYATFSGRASRSEFWWVELFNAIIGGVLYAVSMAMMAGSIDFETGEVTSAAFAVPMFILGLYGLAVIIPNIAVTVRRLHDGNFSGLLYLLVLVPGIGGIVILVLSLMPSVPEGARYDADGGAAAHADAFGSPAGYPDTPAGGFAEHNAPQGYLQQGTQQPDAQQDFGEPGNQTRD